MTAFVSTSLGYHAQELLNENEDRCCACDGTKQISFEDNGDQFAV